MSWMFRDVECAVKVILVTFFCCETSKESCYEFVKKYE